MRYLDAVHTAKLDLICPFEYPLKPDTFRESFVFDNRVFGMKATEQTSPNYFLWAELSRNASDFPYIALPTRELNKRLNFMPSQARFFRSILSGLFFVVTACACTPAVDNHPGQPVTKRKIIFDKMMRTLEPMGRMIRGREPYDQENFLEAARLLESLSEMPWEYFPPGSIYPPSRAKPAVWQNQALFKSKQRNLIDASAALTRVAQTGNLVSIRPAYVNLIKACNDCHAQFRRSGF